MHYMNASDTVGSFSITQLPVTLNSELLGYLHLHEKFPMSLSANYIIPVIENQLIFLKKG